ncbi:MAG: S-layer homology domain-containing protein [Oscillospiraceae bacterium]|nr:S-layer homology domain-containing protein [Oscillospiraceae bacterium]
MKKRILSALLALVMVLALLPATVFAAAAAETGKTSVRYYDKVQPNLLDGNGQKIGPGWYYQFQMDVDNNRKETRYAKVDTGVVTGTSTSGTWYESAEAALAKGQTSFTLLNDQTISGLSRNLTVDTNGRTLYISGADMTKVTSLTVTDARYAAAQKAGLSGSQGSVNWSINNDSNGTQSFTLTLRNGGKLSGSVTLINPANHTITMTDYAQISGSVNMSGNAATNANAQNVSLSNYSKITGTVTLTGNSSRVNVASSEMGDLTLKGTGTQLTVNGIISKVGAVTLNSAQSKTTGTNATVNISQGRVESITQTTDDLKSNIKITVGENGSVGAIMIVNGADITVNQGSTGAITLPSGTLTVNGPSARLGALTLNSTGNTTFKVAGTGNSIASVTAQKGTSLKVDIAAEISNTFGAVSLDGYKGHGIKGGTYKGTAPTADALANSGNEALIYQATDDSSVTTFYTSAQLADGLYKQATKGGTLTIVGQATTSSPSGVITFMRGTNKAGELNYYGVTTIPMLPNKALGTPVATWTDTSNQNKTYNAGGSYDVPQGGGNVILSTQGASQVVTKINGLNLATGTGANHNITASLNGNVITLSGAVEPIGGIASFQLNLLTDLVDNDQKQIIIPVWVNYNSVNKRTYFGNQTLDGGLTVNADGSRLTLFDGSTYYTLNGSGLRVMDENFTTSAATDGGVVATYTGTGDAATKQYVANLIQGTGSSFNWNNSTAVKQAVNAVQAGITSSQVQNWRDQAQRKAWQNHYSGSPTKDQYTTDSVSSGYTQVWLVPYLNVTASKYNQNGTLTAALSVYYRVEVRDTNGGKPIEVQAGRALGTLGEEFGTGVVVKFSNDLNSQINLNGNNAYMRQDDTYVYQNSSDGFTISHSGRTGLGTIVIDQTAPLVMLERSNGATNTTHVGKGQTAYYTTLQAAVNDTQPQPKNHEDRITVLNGYKASDSIDVTGLARTFYIKAEGNTTLTRASNNFTMTPDTTGSLWTVQLAKETATGTVAIYVTDVANGNASASIVRAKAGDTVTITTNPNSGYYTLGVSAVGSNNTSIAVSGSGNSWSFKVPDNVVSVTVTPNFGVGGGQVSINVNNATNGSATVSSGTNNVTQGSTITVYTVPRAGYRATGVSVYFNNGTSVNATNTGTNTWVFTVPAGATTATVTPSFTVETGLPFTDVGSNDFYLQYVNFVYKHGMMEGFGNKYTFNGNGNVTRAQIVLILYRLSGSPSVSGVTKFSDVPANQWYSAAVAWASNNNIVNGRSNSIFDPGTAVTRQELAAILYRYNNYRGLSNGNLSNLSQFTDRGYVQSYAKEAMQWAVGNGIISGTTNTTLSPNGTAIRYQAAAMLTRYCQNFLKMS